MPQVRAGHRTLERSLQPAAAEQPPCTASNRFEFEADHLIHCSAIDALAQAIPCSQAAVITHKLPDQ
jgi:hypothetical protein